MKKQIAAEFNCAELWISEFIPLMDYACGTGALCVAFYSDKVISSFANNKEHE